jgi:ATP-binding cassette subfamily F protein 3
LAGEIKDYSGEWNLGHNVNIGYFAQNQEEVLTPDKTVLQEAEDAATEETRPRVRDLLGSFLLLVKRCKKRRKYFREEKETVWRFVNCCFVRSIR